MNFNNNIKTKLTYIAVSTLTVFGLIFGWNILKNNEKNNSGNEVKQNAAVVHFVDVGQGDCELINCKDKTVLIDSGEKDKGNKVVKYLKDNQVKRLDYVIATHPHTDHIGGLIEVFNNFEVLNLIMPKIPLKLIPTNSTYKKFLQTIKDKKIKVQEAKKGDVLNLGDSSLNLIPPSRDSYSKLNDFSVGALFNCEGFSFLFCGDMEKEAEKDVLKNDVNIKADVFKLSHHGSSTSNTKAFLEKVNPKYCVAEVGKNNSYRHPSEKVLALLKNKKIKLFRTDINGTVVFSIKDKKLNYKTEKGDV